MTLEKRIEQEKLQIEENRDKLACAVVLDNQHAFDACMHNIEEHEQLAEWLEEPKFLRQWKSDVMDGFCRYDASSFEELVINVRNKAIDDFAEKLNAKCDGIINEKWNSAVAPISWAEAYADFKDYIDEIAEQLKEGVGNGT